MASPILTIKLHRPVPRPNAVVRSRLIEQLNNGLSGKLTLISAPAGFGKTTLVSKWLSDCGQPVAWLSLDEADNDLLRFLMYFVLALRNIDPTIGDGVLGTLQAPQPLVLEPMLTALLNEIAALPEHAIVVLDDYHALDSRAIDDILVFLLNHLPPTIHLVIASREDPHFPLARLRVRGQLSELRSSDLSFTPAETTEFFNQVMGLHLSSDIVETLQNRTEGWIASLQLAAVALQGRDAKNSDTATFIQAFTRSHRFVWEYLVEEVLHQQPEAIQQFLLQTSVLDRLCGPLCDAVIDTTAETSQATLELIERLNLLIIPLDVNRHWYRYHHLFTDTLRTYLQKSHPEQVPILHRRASAWYEQNGLPSDAIHHALAAKDFALAAALIERGWPLVRRSRQEATLRRWVKAIPDALVRSRPVLSVVYAWVLLDAGELDAVEAYLQIAEQWLAAPSDEMIVVDNSQFRSLPAAIANARAYRAQAQNDVSSTVQYALQAFTLLPEDDYYERGTTAALLGLADWTIGDLEAAYRYFATGLENLQKGGGVLIRMGGTVILAAIKMAQGRLHEAIDIYEQTIRFAQSQGEPLLKGTAEQYMGLSELYLELGELALAKQHFMTGEALREHASLPGNEHLWCIAQAKLYKADGNLDSAFDSLDEAERLYSRSPVPDVRPIAALKARFALSADSLSDAQTWVRKSGLTVGDTVTYLREYEYLTLVRVLIAQYKHERIPYFIQQAISLLDRLMKQAVSDQRPGSILEILVLQAIAFYLEGEHRAAPTLEQALTLAQAEGYVQLFVDEGIPMQELLAQAAANHIAQAFTDKLLRAFRDSTVLRDLKPTDAPESHALIEALSERERDVLRLLRSELSGPEIARELGVALSTVRTHTKSIYSKLNVTSRRAAINRAAALHLI